MMHAFRRRALPGLARGFLLGNVQKDEEIGVYE